MKIRGSLGISVVPVGPGSERYHALCELRGWANLEELALGKCPLPVAHVRVFQSSLSFQLVSDSRQGRCSQMHIMRISEASWP